MRAMKECFLQEVEWNKWCWVFTLSEETICKLLLIEPDYSVLVRDAVMLCMWIQCSLSLCYSVSFNITLSILAYFWVLGYCRETYIHVKVFKKLQHITYMNEFSSLDKLFSGFAMFIFSTCCVSSSGIIPMEM